MRVVITSPLSPQLTSLSRHNWDDDRCVEILKGIRTAMGKQSRLLIADLVIITTVGSPELAPAPDPLLPNYGVHSRFAHSLDLLMLSCYNGIERTPAQFRNLADRAGLELTKIWECRGSLRITEMHLPA